MDKRNGYGVYEDKMRYVHYYFSVDCLNMTDCLVCEYTGTSGTSGCGMKGLNRVLECSLHQQVVMERPYSLLEILQ